MGPMVGREEQRSTLAGLWHEAATGACQVALVEGPAGYGKTTLLRDLAGRVGPAAVLWAVAEEDESNLPFGVLDQLVRNRPAVGSPVLLAATAGQEADPLVVGSAFLQMLEEVADAPGVLLVVDDLQWADLPSVRALVFALRRLRGPRAMAALACRTENEGRLSLELRRLLDDSAMRVPVGGFDPSDIADLAATLGRPGLSEPALRRVTDHTAGSPLLIRAVLGELSVTQLEGDRDQPLPAPRDVAELVATRLRASTPEGRALVEAAAVAGDGLPLVGLARVAGVAASDAAADGVASGLLRSPLVASAVEIEHPLVRSAVYHGIPRPRRAELQRRLAGHLAVTDVAASLRHRTAAADGPDPALAAVLAGRATHDAAAGSWSAAAHGFLSAANLEESGTLAWSGHIVGLVDCVVLAGDVTSAGEVITMLERFAPGPLRDYGLGRLLALLGELGLAKEHFDAAWAALGQPTAGAGLAARIADEQARHALNSGDSDASVAWSDQALALAGDQAVPGDGFVVRTVALITLGRTAEAAAGYDRPGGPVPTGPAAVGLQVGRGMLRTWTGRISEARDDLDAALAVTSRRGPAALHVFVATAAAEAAYRAGDWDRSVSVAEAAATLARDVGQVRALPLLHANASQPLAARGEWAAASHHADQALEVADAVGEVPSRLWAALAAARLADARSDVPAVLAALACFGAVEDLAVARQPAILAWRGLLAGALVSAGRLDEAADVLERAVPEAAGCLDPVPALELTWVAAELDAARGDIAGAVARIHAGEPCRVRALRRPFDIARFDLAAGSLLRRAGQRRSAADALQRARDGFFELKAAPWVAATDDQLDRCGLRPRLRDEPVTHQLTPNEAAVARLATGGLSNREIAAELIVSVKTVEYHLSNVYRKLGVRSRAKLAARMGSGA